jgi:2,4-dienoyl-CoA reductase-like NADH-dependent reductase (Old Yellow Enzyme family)
MYKHLFNPGKIGNRISINRFVAQPMESNDAVDGGKASERTIQKYVQLAKGGWGIIIVEAISITPKSLARKNALIINRENLDSFKKLVFEVKKLNPEVILLFQITHSGRNSNPAFSEKTTVCPGSTEGRLLTTNEIQEIKDLFVSASLLAEEAGADGVDFKCCHGYFGAEIIRPENTRYDCWGGSWENRTRFFREGVSELQAQKQNKNFIVGSRFSMYEGWRGGCGTTSSDSIIEDLSEMKLYVELMVKLGVDYANVSAGIPGRTSEITRPVKGSELMYLNHLRYTRFTKEVLMASNSDTKVIGSAYSVLKEDAFAVGEEMLEKEFADYIGWGRQILADPFTPVKLQCGESINYCTACSGCSKLMIKQSEVGCILHNPYYKEVWKANLHQ